MAESVRKNHNSLRVKLIAMTVMLFVICMTLAILRWVPRPANTYFWFEIYNWGHLWLFAVIMLVSTWTITKIKPELSFTLTIISAALFSIAFAGMSELMQMDVRGRNADIKDLGRDVAGISISIAGLLFWKYFSRPSEKKLKVAILSLIISFPLFATVTWPVIKMLKAYIGQSSELPILFSPELGWSRPFVTNIRSRLTYASAPENFSDFKGENCLHVRTSRRRFTGVAFTDLYANWSKYRQLNLEIWSGANLELPFLIRLDAAKDPYVDDDWAHTLLTLKPGSNLINVNLNELVNDGTGIRFNRGNVTDILAVTTGRTRPQNLCFGRMTLSN
ncbi:MAG: VanZ family protein [Pseudomonadota bacterium]|nr:VanZ family protein [Pseudomonadota bacterium]